MSFRKKAQAAMEFLMTYGWALLVVLIVIAALAFFGLLNPNRFLPEKCEIAPGVTCMDFSAKTNDSSSSKFNSNFSVSKGLDLISILINNGIGSTMKNVKLNVTECGNGSIGVWNAAASEGVGTIGGAFLGNWTGNVTLNVSSLGSGKTQLFEIPCGGMTPNSKFKSDMIFDYQTVVDSITVNHTKKGYLVVQVELT